MTRTQRRLTFEEYLDYDDGTDNRYELIDGELVELPPESEPNTAIAIQLLLALVRSGVSARLIKPYTCEVQVPVLQSGDAQNRYPDLVVLREEHLSLVQKRLTIKLDMPPPQLIAEVVSPGRNSRERDYERKREQYQAIGVSEYWIIDPHKQAVTVLRLENAEYLEVEFRGVERIISFAFENLTLTAEEVLKVDRSLL